MNQEKRHSGYIHSEINDKFHTVAGTSQLTIGARTIVCRLVKRSAFRSYSPKHRDGNQQSAETLNLHSHYAKYKSQQQRKPGHWQASTED
jgi:hypothetical protein